MKANTPAGSRDRIVKKAEAAAQFGISYSTLYRLIAIKRFPQPVKIGTNRMGFSQLELDAHMAKLKAERGAIVALHEAAHAATARRSRSRGRRCAFSRASKGSAGL